jgi:hypothetical protein
VARQARSSPPPIFIRSDRRVRRCVSSRDPSRSHSIRPAERGPLAAFISPPLALQALRRLQAPCVITGDCLPRRRGRGPSDGAASKCPHHAQRRTLEPARRPFGRRRWHERLDKATGAGRRPSARARSSPRDEESGDWRCSLPVTSRPWLSSSLDARHHVRRFAEHLRFTPSPTIGHIATLTRLFTVTSKC